MYLLDTNIWLELLLNQKKAEEVVKFLDAIKESKIYISSFSLFSICIFLSKINRHDTLNKFVKDLSDNYVEIINISFTEISKISDIEKTYQLDFDDALQYYVSQKYSLTLISYDKDFDKTPEGRITPDIFLFIISVNLNCNQVVYVNVDNPFNESIYIQSYKWEIYFLEDSSWLFAYPDSSYNLNHLVFYKDVKGFSYRTNKYKMNFDNLSIKFTKILPRNKLVLKIYLNDNINLKYYNKVDLNIPYSSAVDFENQSKLNNYNYMKVLNNNDTISINYSIKNNFLNLLETNCDSSNINIQTKNILMETFINKIHTDNYFEK